MKTTRVRFTPQAWVNNYAVTIDADGPLEFEVPVKDAKRYDGKWRASFAYESDGLKDHANAPKWIRDHRGPFEIEILHGETCRAAGQGEGSQP